MLYSVRMRASKQREKKRRGSVADPTDNGIHISGAEGLYRKEEIAAAVDGCTARAMGHSRGEPDSIFITIEKITEAPKRIRTLPLATVRNRSCESARRLIREFLLNISVSEEAIRTALEIVSEPAAMRGAAIVRARSGLRVDPDYHRGVRVSRLGITQRAGQNLSRELSRYALDCDTVREALILASKVASCAPVIAELCVSDDPDYTTGYVASRAFGYARLPHIKRRNARTGGRVFFIRENAIPDAAISYLEKTPVMVTGISPCHGTCSASEIIGHRHL